MIFINTDKFLELVLTLEPVEFCPFVFSLILYPFAEK